MSEPTWFDQYRQYVAGMVFSGVVSSGLRLPLYESPSMCKMVASMVTLIPEAQRVGIIYKREQLAQDPSYMVAELFVTTRDGWELTMEVAVKQEDFMEYKNYMEDLACKLQKLERFHYPGEMVQYRPTGETLRSWLDHCVEMSPWKNSQARASDFLYSNDQVDLSLLVKQHEPTQDTYNTPIRVKM